MMSLSKRAAVLLLAVSTCGVLFAGCANEKATTDDAGVASSVAATESNTAEAQEPVAEISVIASQESVYQDPNGWSVKYDASNIEVTQKDNQVFFVYTGECSGTTMVTVTYTAGSTGEDTIKALGESWGDTTTFQEGPFPGAEEETGYWAILPPGKDGMGMYMTAVGRDYMEGSLVFELTGHNGEDEELNMATSDAMAGIIDSLTFE